MHITNSLVLRIAYANKEFVLCTNSCKKELGEVLVST